MDPMNRASRDTGFGPEPDSSAPRRRGGIRKAPLIFFALMVVLGFAGILWTEKGAPGHKVLSSVAFTCRNMFACLLVRFGVHSSAKRYHSRQPQQAHAGGRRTIGGRAQGPRRRVVPVATSCCGSRIAREDWSCDLGSSFRPWSVLGMATR